MKKPRPACIGCNDRAPECHANCKEYNEYKAALEEYNKMIKEAKDKESCIRDVEFNGKRRAKKVSERRFIP